MKEDHVKCPQEGGGKKKKKNPETGGLNNLQWLGPLLNQAPGAAYFTLLCEYPPLPLPLPPYSYPLPYSFSRLTES